MKPSGLREDLFIVGGVVAGSSLIDGHAEAGAFVACVTACAGALSVVLRRQGN